MVDSFIVVRTLHYITAYYCFSNTFCDEDKLVVSYFKTYIGGVISLIPRYRGHCTNEWQAYSLANKHIHSFSDQ